MKKTIVPVILISTAFLFSCAFSPPLFDNLLFVPEIELEEAWNIKIGDKNYYSGEYIFNENRMFLYINNSLQSDKFLYTIDLDTHTVINTAIIPAVSNIAFCGNKLYASNPSLTQPVLYTADVNGNLTGIIPIDNDYNFSSTMYSHNNRLYWCAERNTSSFMVRMNTAGVPQVEEIYSGGGDFFFFAEPRFYDGIGFFTAEPLQESTYTNTRLISFNEESKAIIAEKELDKALCTYNNRGIVLKSGDNILINGTYIDPATGKTIQNNYQIGTAPYKMLNNEAGFYGYSENSDAIKGNYSVLWKLTKNTLEVVWQSSFFLEISAQMQIDNEILYIPAKNQFIMVNSENGKVIAKDSNLTTAPNIHANTCIHNDELIYFDGTHIRALKTDWKINLFGGIADDE